MHEKKQLKKTRKRNLSEIASVFHAPSTPVKSETLALDGMPCIGQLIESFDGKSPQSNRWR
jgi:hypothetical protein